MYGKVKSFSDGAVVKARPNWPLVIHTRPETRRPTHGQGEAPVILEWRPALGNVVKLRDELWVEQILQSSLEIAGSPRNIYRYSLHLKHKEVELW